MAISQELQKKLDYYEQVYNSLDEPIPLKGKLKCHPVKVKDYYRFYNCLGSITMDKNIKTVTDEYGRPKKISNPKGIGQSYLEYLIEQMQDPENGAMLTAQVMELFSLVFNIEKGVYCPKCNRKVNYETLFSGLSEEIKKAEEEAQKIYSEALLASNKQEENDLKDNTIPKEILDKITQNARNEYFKKALNCPDCEQRMLDVFSIKEDNGIKSFSIMGTDINPSDFDEFKAIVPRQNILDYDGDKYVDPDLKEELELKAQMQNKDYTSPTLEKQLVCVAISTGYSFEYLQSITMRKLSIMLRLIDKKNTYYAQLQASMSGMVTFKEPPAHWIFSDDKKNIKDELTSIDDFEKKFDRVV